MPKSINMINKDTTVMAQITKLYYSYHLTGKKKARKLFMLDPLLMLRDGFTDNCSYSHKISTAPFFSSKC
jgi:hypothetical protein